MAHMDVTIRLNGSRQMLRDLESELEAGIEGGVINFDPSVDNVEISEIED